MPVPKKSISASVLWTSTLAETPPKIDPSHGSSVKAGHGLPPATAGIGVWLDGAGQAGIV